MKDQYLELLKDWRYCRVKANDKRPYPANWQATPLALSFVDSPNIGVILGPFSGGTCALDFDGTSAWTWYADNIGCELPPTVMWSSGRKDRCQMAFRVPEAYWDRIRTKKLELEFDTEMNKHEGFEFRWRGGQSVVPPSVHPDTQQPYFWIKDRTPQHVPVAELPKAVLDYWMSITAPAVATVYIDEPTVATVTEENFLEAKSLLDQLKQTHPTLGYDTWREVSWAVAKSLGRDVAIVLLQDYYPEDKPNEYRTVLFKNYDVSRSPSLNKIRAMLAPKLPTRIRTGNATGKDTVY